MIFPFRIVLQVLPWELKNFNDAVPRKNILA